MELTNTHHGKHTHMKKAPKLFGRFGLKKSAANIISHGLGGWHKGRLAVIGLSNVSDHVKVLRQEQEIHDFLGGRSLDTIGKVHNGRFQSIHNGLALFGHTNTGKIFGFRFGFGRFHLQNLVSLGTFGHGKFQTLRGVDFVHGVLDPLIGIQVGDERLENLVSKRRHGLGEGILDGQRQIFLGFKDGIEFQSRELRSHDIIHVCRDLLCGIRQCVKGFVGLFTKDLILDRNDGRQKHIVQCLGFDAHVQLLNAERKTTDQFFIGTKDKIQTGLDHAAELSAIFHETNL
mmetsp:Transcript_8554/g.19813  ORF Transcript_8554/g.19813 Transcript_8554/m.19813 type:complete len:288 (+) Transcript_8554:645-1508(+)